jgi:hypothetical protein
MSISIYNSTISPLISGQVFSGAVYDNILDFAEIDISILCDTGYTLEYIYSQNKVDVNYTTTQIIPFSASTQFYKAPVLDRYFKIQITATDGDMILLNVQTIYKSVITFTEGYGADVNIISPLDANGYVEVSAMNLVPLPSANIRTPSQLIVNDWYKVESLGNTPGAVWAEMGAIIGSESFPPIGRVFKCLEPRYGTGTVSTVVYSQNTYDVNLAQCISSSNVNVLVNNTTPISVSISNLPTENSNVNIYDSSGVSITLGQQTMAASLPVVFASDQTVLNTSIYKPTDDGVTTSFEITASAVNNAAVYYADETQGNNVAGGWQFTSTLHSSGTKNTKINWYMYQPANDVVITDLSNNPTNTYYTIIENVGVEFPMIYIYTKPTVPATKISGGTAGSSWYQSKFVYQANQAGTVGTYLLYCGANPTTIRPDLTHINLIKLDILCLGTLQPNEIVMSASLQTSSNLGSPAGNFSLTMSKFGVVIPPVDTPLRVDASGALVCTGSVALKAGTTVAISNTAFDSNITNTFLTVKAKPTYSISIDSAGNTSQPIRTSAGVLHTVIITSVNTTFPLPSTCDYVKIYNSSSATSADSPLAILPIRYGERLVFQADMNFSAGLCVRATSLYSISDASVPASTIYLTCFLTGYSE